MALSKKKITQDELRRLMNEQKKKLLSNVKKIESPLAKYDKNGLLHCILCETVVRSEAVWSVHLNSKNHKQNLSKIKNKEEKPKVLEPLPSSHLKRTVPIQVPVPQKKIKGILKTSSSYKSKENAIEIDSDPNFTDINSENEGNEDVSENEANCSDSNMFIEPENESINQEKLPEGFFDDPKLDAKARNVEYRDPIEEEWLQFQKEIKEETSKAQQIIAEDQEEATTERQIDEIDEQIRNWSRVLDLEKKKEVVNATVIGVRSNECEEDNSEGENEFEEFLDWRSKKSFEYNLNKNFHA